MPKTKRLPAALPIEQISRSIVIVRGHKVLLDSNLAVLFEFDAERSRRRTLIDYCGWCAKSREDSPISKSVAVDRAPELAKTNAVSYARSVSRFE
jgi:hypothetical protein